LSLYYIILNLEQDELSQKTPASQNDYFIVHI